MAGFCYSLDALPYSSLFREAENGREAESEGICFGFAKQGAEPLVAAILGIVVDFHYDCPELAEGPLIISVRRRRVVGLRWRRFGVGPSLPRRRSAKPP
ncbi:hypothetical protein MLD52_21910 [Puniceicoccaceae bacterium K14]|nr:hypothetical protein [Puniceicoccaceae bacterium K14]